MKCLSACCLALLVPMVVEAREPRKGDLVVRFVADSVPADLGEVRLVAGRKTSDSLRIPVNNLSGALVAPARSFEARPVDGGDALATVKLPAKGNSFVVMLASAEEGFKPVVVPADQRLFKGGELYFFNNTDKTIVGTVGEQELEIETGKGELVRPKQDASKPSYAVSLFVREDSGDRVLSTTTWPLDKNIRSFVFFFVNQRTKRIDYRAVEEFVAK